MMAAGDTMVAAWVAVFSLLEIEDMNRKITNWAALLELGQHQVTGDDVKILQLLAAGNSTPQIARSMGISRSMVWRTSQRLKAQLEAQLEAGQA
jgi:DNA-binding CsgD family transcriptional regulator